MGYNCAYDKKKFKYLIKNIKKSNISKITFRLQFKYPYESNFIASKLKLQIEINQ